MAAQIAGVFEPLLQQKISESKILVVGAGGIGCEVLKNLVMSGFSDIEIVSESILINFNICHGSYWHEFFFFRLLSLQIDLDTIDVSNLNRQFLFHKEHVGKSKAEVARESALAFNPKVEIKAYHDSITT